jgi:cysteinyl-tRNA synthetase
MPRAIAELHTLDRSGDLSMLSSALNFLGFSRDKAMLRRTVHLEARSSARLYGTGTLSVNATVKTIPPVLDPKDVDKLIADRNAARKAKDFRAADRIRDELAAMGVVLKDSKDGTTWEIAR